MCRSWPKSTGSELEVLAHLWPSGGRRGWRWRGEGRVVDVVHTAANKYHLCSCLILILHTMYTLLRATEGLCLRLDVPMFLYLAIQLVLLTIDQHSCTPRIPVLLASNHVVYSANPHTQTVVCTDLFFHSMIKQPSVLGSHIAEWSICKPFVPVSPN